MMSYLHTVRNRNLESHNSPYITHHIHRLPYIYGTVLLLHYCNTVIHKHLLVLWECAPVGVDQKAEWVAWDPG